MAVDRSRIQDVGAQASSCGYCGSKEDTSISHGMFASVLTPQDYQDLIDLGWRRSGKYLYKPDQEVTCCPPYTIRMSATDFEPNKDQRRLLKRLALYLSGKGPSPWQNKPSTPASTQQDTPMPAVEPQDMPMQDGSHSAANAQPAPAQGAPIGNTKDAVRAALAAILTSAVDVLQATGLLPQKMEVRPIAVQDRTTRTPKRARGNAQSAPSTQSPQPAAAAAQPTLDLCSPCCMALAAAAAKAATSADKAASNAPAPSPANTVLQQGKKQPSSAQSSTPHSLAVAMTQATEGLLHALRQGSSVGSMSEGGDMEARQGPSTHSTDPALSAAVQSVVQPLQAKLRGIANQWAAGCGQQQANGHTHMAQASGSYTATYDGLVSLLPACQVAAEAGYINITCPLPTDTQQTTQQQQQQQLAGTAAAAAAAAPPQRKHGAHGPQLARQSTPDVPMQFVERANANGGGRAAMVTSPCASDAGYGSGHRGVGDLGVAAMGTSRLEVVLVPSQFIQEEYELYKRYQMAQHGDTTEDASPKQYTTFLVDSPLRPQQPPQHGAARTAQAAAHAAQGSITVTADQALAALEPSKAQGAGSGGMTEAAQGGQQGSGVPSLPCGYGSFHMQYRIDGVLVAVGVVDVLPSCLSSVYLFWDPDLRHLGLGKLSALYELLWVHQACKVCPDLRWYYMGFYIHSCHKMRYKADYMPSDLLCPNTRLWVRIQPSLLTALDKAKLVPLSSLPHTRVFRNHAHSQEETQSAAATIGRSLANPYTHSDELLSQPSDSSGIDTNTGQASANGATAMQGVANTQAGVSPQSASSSQPGGASDVKESTGVSQEDVDRVMIHLWKQTAPWKYFRQMLTEEGVRYVKDQLESWLPLVGSGLGQRLVYSLSSD